MIIDQLPAALSVDPTDELPIEKGQLTYKATFSQIADKATENLANEVEGLKTSIIQASGYAVTGNGTSGQLSLTGLTADHVVGNWGMFSDSAYTTPIPENAPTCDLTITTYSGYWTYTVANFTSTFYLKPTFIKD